jgi:cell wall-associated NlpC family hydrolase
MHHLRELLLVGFAVLATGCATTGAVPRPFPGAQPAPVSPAPGVPDTSAVPPAGAELLPPAPMDTPGSMALATALGFQGVPYRSGGSTPSGFDCSGLVQYVFAQHGIAMPRDVRHQYQVGYQIDTQQVRPGDLLFFKTSPGGASHVAIALDGMRFVHAPNSRGVVRVDLLSTPYWSTRLLGARRIE